MYKPWWIIRKLWCIEHRVEMSFKLHGGVLAVRESWEALQAFCIMAVFTQENQPENHIHRGSTWLRSARQSRSPHDFDTEVLCCLSFCFFQHTQTFVSLFFPQMSDKCLWEEMLLDKLTWPVIYLKRAIEGRNLESDNLPSMLSAIADRLDRLTLDWTSHPQNKRQLQNTNLDVHVGLQLFPQPVWVK